MAETKPDGEREGYGHERNRTERKKKGSKNARQQKKHRILKKEGETGKMCGYKEKGMGKGTSKQRRANVNKIFQVPGISYQV